MLFDDHPTTKLVGIARLAASDLFEAKKRVEYFELETRWLYRTRLRRMREIFTVNPYRGCEFGCKYCYARYAHEFMELRQSGSFRAQDLCQAFPRPWFREWLRRLKRVQTIRPELPRSLSAGRTPLSITGRSGMSFARAEERGFVLGITTKSDLVARDAELLARIGRKNSVSVHLTITTLDEALTRLLEPRAPRPALRVAALRKLTDAGVRVGVLAHPMMPLINDSEKSIAAVCQAAVVNGYFFL